MEERSKEYVQSLMYFEEVYRVRSFIVKRMHGLGFEFTENKVLIPNPSWNNRLKSTNAIGLVCWTNDLPLSLLTPWGEIRLVDIETNTGFSKDISEEKAVQFMAELNDLFYLTQMGPGMAVHGFSCPTYSIGALPWSNKDFHFLEMESRCLGDTEQLLINRYNEGKQFCLDIFGRATAV